MNASDLVDWLASQGLLDPSRRQDLVEAMGSSEQETLSVLESMGIIERNRLFHLVAQEIGGVYYDLSNFTPDPQVVSVFSAEFAHRHQAVPIQSSEQGIQVAIVNPFDPSNLDEIAFHLNIPVTPVVASSEQVKALLKRTYGESLSNDVFIAASKRVHENDSNETRTDTLTYRPLSSSRLAELNVPKKPEKIASKQPNRKRKPSLNSDKIATPNFGPLYKSYIATTYILAIVALIQIIFGIGNSFFGAFYEVPQSPENSQADQRTNASSPSLIFEPGIDIKSDPPYQLLPKGNINPSPTGFSQENQEFKEIESKLREMTQSDSFSGYAEIERKLGSSSKEGSPLKDILTETKRKGIASRRFHPELAIKRKILPPQQLISDFPEEIAFSRTGENIFICNRKSETGTITIRSYNLSESRLSDIWSGSPSAVHFSQHTRSLAYVDATSWWEFVNLDTGKRLPFQTSGSYSSSRFLVTFDREFSRAYYLDGYGQEIRVIGWDLSTESKIFETALSFSDPTYGSMRMIDANAVFLSLDQSILYIIAKRSVKGFVDKSDQYFLLGFNCESKAVISSRKFEVKWYDVPSGEAVMKDPSLVGFFKEDTSLLLFNPLTLTNGLLLKGERRYSRFEFFNRASCVIASSVKRPVSLFDLSSGEKYCEIGGEFLSATIDPSGRNLAAVNLDGSIDLWSYELPGSGSGEDAQSHQAAVTTRLPTKSENLESPSSELDLKVGSYPRSAKEHSPEGVVQPDLPAEPANETWTNARGVTLEAALVRTTPSNAVFKSSDGKLHQVSFENLSPESRARVMVRDFQIAESSQGHAPAILRIYDHLAGQIVQEPNHSDPATAAILEAARRGDHEAEALVGERFYDGLGTFPVNRVEALKWFVKSARGGSPLGRLWIATMTSKGEIGASDPPLTLYRRALPDLVQIVAGNNAKAPYWRASAECYAGGEGVSLGARQPKGLLERAIGLGDPRARLLLGEYLINSNDISGVGHLRYASDARCATAATALAKYYLGRGNEPKLAPKLLRTAAVKNDIEAQFLLGSCCAKGTGEMADFSEAAFWLQLGRWNAVRLADLKREAQLHEAIKMLEPTIGKDLIRIAATYFEKKNGVSNPG